MKKLKQFLVKKFKESKLVKETIRRLWDSRFFSDLFHIMVIILLILIINTILLIINKIIFLIMKIIMIFIKKAILLIVNIIKYLFEGFKFL